MASQSSTQDVESRSIRIADSGDDNFDNCMDSEGDRCKNTLHVPRKDLGESDRELVRKGGAEMYDLGQASNAGTPAKYDKPIGCLTSKAALSRYASFPALYKERISASNYPFSNKAMPKGKGFASLPAELRLNIFRLVIPNGQTIDLLPHSHPVPSMIQRGLDEYREHTKNLKLLRVSTMINRECRAIFYGENVFRFGANQSWIWMKAFFATIGPMNVACVRSIMALVPWVGRDPTTSNIGPNEFSCSSRGLKVLDLNTTMTPAHRGCMDALNKAGNLRSLTLILPFAFRISSVEDLGIDEAKFMNGIPEIKLLHVRRDGAHGPAHEVQASHKPLRKYHLETATRKSGREKQVRKVIQYKDVKTFCATMGWKYEVTRVSTAGIFVGEDGFVFSRFGPPVDLDEPSVEGTGPEVSIEKAVSTRRKN